MLPVGCISHDDESPLPPKPGRDPDVPGCDPALLDGYPCPGVHVLLEFFFMGIIRSGIVVRDDRFRDVYADEEGIRSQYLCGWH